MVAIKK